MHQFLDDMQDHFGMILLGLAVFWAMVIWAWRKLVVSPKALRDCYERVSIEGKREHERIEAKLDHILTLFISHFEEKK